MASSHQRNIPLGRFEYHVFLTHNWGPEPWENHQRVSVVNAGLAKRGLKTWFDQTQIKGDIPRIMTKGVEDACVVVVFITEEYIRKVNSKNYDACKFEFDHAMAHRDQINMIPVLMERVDKPWKGPVGASLGNHLHVDMTAGPTEETITELFNMIMHRIGEEVGHCPSPALPSSSASSALLPTSPSTPYPTSAAVDELATILNSAKLGGSERQTIENILREEAFDSAHAILLMTQDHAKQMGIKAGRFLQIVDAAKQASDPSSNSSTATAATAPQIQDQNHNKPRRSVVPSNPQQALRGQAVGFKHGNVHLSNNNTTICWRHNKKKRWWQRQWNPVQNTQQAAAVTRVEISGSGITGEDFPLLCEILTYCPNIEHINLSNNNLGDAEVTALAEALPALPKLTDLSLYGNGITGKGAQALCKTLPSLPLLQSLHLGGNNLGDKGAAALAEALPALPKLRALWLYGNKTTVKGAQDLCKTLPSLPLLQLLSLGDNNLGDGGAAALAEALPALSNLKEFYLYGNGIGDKGLQRLVGVLRNMPSLTDVWLQVNRASDHVIQTARNTLSFVRELYL